MKRNEIDIAELLIRKAGTHLAVAYNISIQDPSEGDAEEEALVQNEAEACIQAILLFQSGMEAIINEEIETNRDLHVLRIERQFYQKKLKDLSFKNKWERAYVVMGVQGNQSHLDGYLEFYRRFRVPITHPRNRYTDISGYRFEDVYEGLRHGWFTFMSLTRMTDAANVEESWKQFCDTCGLPADVFVEIR